MIAIKLPEEHAAALSRLATDRMKIRAAAGPALLQAALLRREADGLERQAMDALLGIDQDLAAAARSAQMALGIQGPGWRINLESLAFEHEGDDACSA